MNRFAKEHASLVLITVPPLPRLSACMSNIVCLLLGPIQIVYKEVHLLDFDFVTCV